MFSTHHMLKRLSGGIAVAAVLAALAAPAALAKQDPWYRNAVSSSAGAGNAAFTTDTLAPGGGSAQTQGYRHRHTRAGRRNRCGLPGRTGLRLDRRRHRRRRHHRPDGHPARRHAAPVAQA